MKRIRIETEDEDNQLSLKFKIIKESKTTLLHLNDKYEISIKYTETENKQYYININAKKRELNC